MSATTPGSGRPGPSEPFDLSRMREAYDHGESPVLAEESAPADPLQLFTTWFAEVAAAGLVEPNAMVVATVAADGSPRARTVLLKGYDAEGLRFFTNTRSAKATELAVHPRAAAVFPWHPLRRQVRVTGPVAPLSDEVVAAYFATRPREAQLGAWASPQSAVVASRAELDDRLAEVTARFPPDEPVPVPPHWGGYRVVPEEWEFWAGRSGRLHDRLRYRRTDSTSPAWARDRLAP